MSDERHLVKWDRWWVAKIRNVPTALGYPYEWGGQSERYFRGTDRGRRRAERWLDAMQSRGVRP